MPLEPACTPSSNPNSTSRIVLRKQTSGLLCMGNAATSMDKHDKDPEFTSLPEDVQRVVWIARVIVDTDEGEFSA